MFVGAVDLAPSELPMKWKGPWQGDDYLYRYYFDDQALPAGFANTSSGTGGSTISFQLDVPSGYAAAGHNYSLSMGGSNVVGTNEVTWTVTVPGGGARLVFWREVSSEPGFDFCKLLVDGVAAYSTSGVGGGWQEITVPLLGGTRVLKWQLTHDASGTSGTNSHRIADIRLIGGSSPGAAASYCPRDAVSYHGDIWVALAASTNVVPAEPSVFWQRGTTVPTSLLTILDEGVAQSVRTRLDFVGAAVTVTDDAANAKTIVTVKAADYASRVYARGVFR